MKYYRVKKGVFHQRPNRFIAHIEIDGQAFECTHYKEVYEKLKTLLSLKVKNDKGLTVVKTSSLCKVVEMRTATSVGEVEQIYTEWVEGEGAEGARPRV